MGLARRCLRCGKDARERVAHFLPCSGLVQLAEARCTSRGYAGPHWFPLSTGEAGRKERTRSTRESQDKARSARRGHYGEPGHRRLNFTLRGKADVDPTDEIASQLQLRLMSLGSALRRSRGLSKKTAPVSRRSGVALASDRQREPCLWLFTIELVRALARARYAEDLVAGRG